MFALKNTFSSSKIVLHPQQIELFAQHINDNSVSLLSAAKSPSPPHA